MPPVRLLDRIKGCLLGGACGDALGWPVEFLRLRDIRRIHGPSGITDFGQTRDGEVTDDTQMTLFTVEGLIRADVRLALKGICNPVSVVHHAYLRWLETQDPGSFVRSRGQEPDGWLIREKRLWARRAPGNTCLSALEERGEIGAFAANTSKGCGAVMRSAPFGFLPSLDTGFRLAVDCARTTHGHPSGYLAAGALSLIIGHIVQGFTMPNAVRETLRRIENHDGAEEVCSALEQALRCALAGDWRDRLPELGEGWVAEEALAIAVLCAVAARTPKEAIIAAVNHDGDTDSTGSIAGNILGALHGTGGFPSEWLERVELRDVIGTLATDFASVLEGEADAEELWDRYPGH